MTAPADLSRAAPPDLGPEALATPDRPARGPWATVLRRLSRNRSAVASALCLLLVIVLSLSAPLYARMIDAEPFRSNLRGTLTVDGAEIPVMQQSTTGLGLGVTPIGPTWDPGGYLLGADNQGRDVAARLLYGGRNSLLIAGAATVICLVLATLVGALAGFLGGVVDMVLSRILDVLWAFPVYLLAISLSIVLLTSRIELGFMTITAGSLALPIGIIGIIYVPYVARPIRSRVLTLRHSEFVLAAEGLGLPTSRILTRDILPNLMPTIIVYVPILLALAIVTESALSYLSIGVQPPDASWGTIIQDGQSLLYSRPIVALAPGIAIVITVLALNVLGDAVRDALDPRGDRPMIATILQRLAQMAFVMFGISVLVFLIFFATPGSDPAARIAGRNAAPETVEQIRHEFGFDRALPVQYGVMMKRLFITRDLTSFVNRGQRVIPQVLNAVPATLSLVTGAALLWIVGGIAVGVAAAAMRDTVVDRLLMVLSLIGISMPVFWLGEVMNLVSQSRYHDTWAFSWVPRLGYVPLSESVEGWFKALVIPWITLAVLYIGIYARVLRSNLIEAYSEDYIRTARAKGLSPSRVMIRHALRTSMLPFVTMFGLDFGALVGGAALLTEVVFGLNGVGRLTFHALQNLDLPVILATVIYASFFVVAANAIVDMLYAVIDPRVRA